MDPRLRGDDGVGGEFGGAGAGAADVSGSPRRAPPLRPDPARSPRRADPDDPRRSDRPPPALGRAVRLLARAAHVDRAGRGPPLPRPHRRRLGGSGAQHLGQSVGQRRHAGRLHDHDAAGRPGRRRSGAPGRRAQRRGQARADRRGAADRGALVEGADPGGLSEPRADARRAGRRAGGVAGAAGQAAQRAGRGRGGDPGGAGARAERAARGGGAASVRAADGAAARLRDAGAGCGPCAGGRRRCPRAAARATERRAAPRPAGAAGLAGAAGAAPGHLAHDAGRTDPAPGGAHAAAPARRAEPAPCRGRCGRRARQRHRRGDRLGRLVGRGAVGRGGGGHGAGAAPAGLDAQALRLRDGLRAPPDHPGQPDRGRADAADGRQRRLRAAELRPRLPRLGQRARGAGVEPEHPGRAPGRDADARRPVRAAQRLGAGSEPQRRLPRRGAGAGQRRDDAGGADERLSRAGQRRPPRAGAAGRQRRGGLAGRRHPVGQRGARGHLRAGQSPGDARLRGGQDRNQQGSARQLVRRLDRPLHGRRLGRQRQRRADAGRQRHDRRRAGLACAGAGPARARRAAVTRAALAAGPGAPARRR